MSYFLPFWNRNISEWQYSCSGCLSSPSSLLAHKISEHSLRAPSDIQAWKWAWRIMGYQSNGLSIKKPQMNPQKNNSPARGFGFHDTEQAEPPQINTSPFPSFSTTALCASKLRNHKIHLPCPPLRCSSLLSLFGQGEEEERCPGWVWQLMLLLWGGLTVNWIVPRVQSSALSTESFPSLHIPRVLTTSSHSSLQY